MHPEAALDIYEYEENAPSPFEDYAESGAVAEEKKQPIQLEEIKQQIKAIYLTGGPKKRKNPFIFLPDEIGKELIYEAFEQKPWSPTDCLSLNIDGVECPIPYRVFLKSNNLEKLKKWRSAAIDRYVQSTFDRACELLSDRIRIICYDGWPRARKWWPEIIERAFRKTPFTPLNALILTHNNKTIRSPYDHARRSKDKGDMEYIQKIYEKIFKEYIEENFDHALEYIFRNKGFSWEKVPKKWHKEFLKRCFEQNPFKGLNTDLKLTRNGRTIGPPNNYYTTQGRHKDLAKMAREILIEYLSSAERVMAFVNHYNFQYLRGWNTVPARYHRALIINAVLQSKIDNPKIGDLIYTSRNNGAVNIQKLYEFYSRQGQTSVFHQYLTEAFEIKKKEIISPQDKRQKNIPQKAKTLTPKTEEEEQIAAQNGWISEPLDKGKLNELILQAQNGGVEAKFAVVRSFGALITGLARKFACGDKLLTEELTSEGIIIAERCVKRFDFGRKITFCAYLFNSLNHEFSKSSLAYKNNRPKSLVKTIGARISALGRLSDNQINYRSGDPEEIAQITNQKIETVLRDQNALRTNFISLEEPIRNNDNRTHGDFIKNEKNQDFIDIVFSKTLRDAIMKILNNFNLRDQIWVRRHFGMQGPYPVSAYDLKNSDHGKINLQTITSAVAEFQNKLSDFCENPIFGSIETIKILRSLIDSSPNPEDTMNGENALGKTLITNNVNPAISEIISHIINLMEPGKAIIAAEIFNLPTEQYTSGAIGRTFGVSGEAVRIALNKKILPKIKRFLKNRKFDQEGNFASA
ncbi:hypothetical protein HZA39_01435 [Candidatus Peregrinibacteria bacterium]|nr:hypothetical protein [Candidatus Peregrinibacteria bacterium]